MNYKISFQERAQLAQKILSKQSPVTLEQAKKASGKTISIEFTKEQEAEKLKLFISEHRLWSGFVINEDVKIGEGAEQKVFLQSDGKNVTKTNDAIFYLFWVDYFNSLLLHNYYFPDTAYTLSGFIEKDKTLFAVIEQPFVQSDSLTNLNDVRIMIITTRS